MAHKEMTAEERKREFYTAGKVEAELEYEFDAEVGPLELIVEAWFRPARPAPACSDHDHPNFSDPGDGYEFEVVAVKLKNGGHLADIVWKNDDDFNDKAGEALDETYEKEKRESWED